MGLSAIYGSETHRNFRQQHGAIWRVAMKLQSNSTIVYDWSKSSSRKAFLIWYSHLLFLLL